MHTRETIIHERLAHIRRKKRILKYVYGEVDSSPWGCDGELSKGKIHCSCPMCREKTWAIGPKHSDKKKMLTI